MSIPLLDAGLHGFDLLCSGHRLLRLCDLLDGPALAHSGPLALIELLNGPDTPQYVAGTENFYAITRYNWSSYYAMAVIGLGKAVAQELKNSR